jgi:hypothetical protein
MSRSFLGCSAGALVPCTFAMRLMWRLRVVAISRNVVVPGYCLMLELRPIIIRSAGGPRGFGKLTTAHRPWRISGGFVPVAV